MDRNWPPKGLVLRDFPDHLAISRINMANVAGDMLVLTYSLVP